MTIKPRSPEVELLIRLEHLDAQDEANFEDIPGYRGTVLGMTDLAVKLVVTGNREEWFPYSQLRKYRGTVVASTWLLEKKGL